VSRRRRALLGCAAAAGLLAFIAGIAPTDATWSDGEYAKAGLTAANLAAARKNSATYAAGCSAVGGAPTEFDFSASAGLPTALTSFKVVVTLDANSSTITSSFNDAISGGPAHTAGAPSPGSTYTAAVDSSGNGNWKISINVNTGLITLGGSASFHGTIAVYPVIGNWVAASALTGTWRIDLAWSIGLLGAVVVTPSNLACAWS